MIANGKCGFYIKLPVGGLSCLFILFFFVSEPPKSRPGWLDMLRQLDINGVTLIIGFMICFILAMQWGGASKSWNNADIIGTIVGFALCLLLFLAAQKWQGENAMVQGRIIKRRTVAVGSIFSFL